MFSVSLKGDNNINTDVSSLQYIFYLNFSEYLRFTISKPSSGYIIINLCLDPFEYIISFERAESKNLG